MSDDGKPDFEVGYGKPPTATRFSAGQSGNPKGRPRGAKNFATALAQELNARVAIKENGLRKVIPKRQAVAKQLVNKAVSGDLKAIQPLLNATSVHEREAAAAAINAPMGALATEDDSDVMAGILHRILGANPEHAPIGSGEAVVKGVVTQQIVAATREPAPSEGGDQ